MTALHEERAAVLAALGNARQYRQAGRGFHFATVRGVGIGVFSLLCMGNVEASSVTTEIICTWRPRAVILVGIAGGIRGHSDNLRLGDVVIADQVVGFEQARITRSGWQRRFQTYPSDPDLLAAAKELACEVWEDPTADADPTQFSSPDGAIRAHVGTVFSGEKVFADRDTVEELRKGWSKAVAVEMESLGVALACYRTNTAFLVIKGICDLADQDKDDQWREHASNAAAYFALAFLRRDPIPGAAPRHRSGVHLLAAAAALSAVAVSIIVLASPSDPGSTPTPEPAPLVGTSVSQSPRSSERTPRLDQVRAPARRAPSGPGTRHSSQVHHAIEGSTSESVWPPSAAAPSPDTSPSPSAYPEGQELLAPPASQ